MDVEISFLREQLQKVTAQRDDLKVAVVELLTRVESLNHLAWVVHNTHCKETPPPVDPAKILSVVND